MYLEKNSTTWQEKPTSLILLKRIPFSNILSKDSSIIACSWNNFTEKIHEKDSLNLNSKVNCIPFNELLFINNKVTTYKENKRTLLQEFKWTITIYKFKLAYDTCQNI